MLDRCDTIPANGLAIQQTEGTDTEADTVPTKDLCSEQCLESNQPPGVDGIPAKLLKGIKNGVKEAISNKYGRRRKSP